MKIRLAQLAVKLSLRQSEIVSFLASHGVDIEKNPNAQIAYEDALKVSHHFNALQQDRGEEQKAALEDGVGKEMMSPNTPSSPETEQQEVVEVDALDESVAEAEEILVPPEQAENEEQEMIKAPKVMLQGLKIVGKIELSDPSVKEKEKEQQNKPDEPAAPVEKKPALKQNGRKKKKPVSFEKKNTNRSRKKPVAIQGERQDTKIDKKKAERKKQSRTRSYHNKMSRRSPSVSQRARNNKSDYEVYETYLEGEEPKKEVEQPKNWLGKLARWFTGT